jgi:hypothetical protein
MYDHFARLVADIRIKSANYTLIPLQTKTTVSRTANIAKLFVETAENVIDPDRD